MFGILGLASLGPNPGVSEVRGRVCWLFRIQAYVSLGFCAPCIASGGAAWDSVSPTSPTFPVSFSAETPWCGGCVGYSDPFISGTGSGFSHGEPM